MTNTQKTTGTTNKKGDFKSKVNENSGVLCAFSDSKWISLELIKSLNEVKADISRYLAWYW